MKQILIIITVTITIFGLGYFLDSSSIPTQVSIEQEHDEIINTKIALPQFKFNDLEGTQQDITKFQGKKIILNFWATWCGPCKEEFPEMLEILKEDNNTVLVAISNDANKIEVQKFIKKLKTEAIDLESERVFIGFDPNKEISSELFNVLRLPETFIIDSQMNIIRKVIGSYHWTNKDMHKFIKEMN
ncbi:TlpA disulfide reductase family protein [Halobacteriovorax sp. HLS]|uniref:TlpA family protein disulfide reductase n=1 Tax=Halobacteriovorax sp. HLS TaxID=2234000 RepID=UPI000FDA14AF|nr:TlpA disulfide reductase family protein [Halobacteriovorax sp. HLS]